MLLELIEISKHFGGIQAISPTTFSVQKGEIFGLIGPNGAGKTTMFNIITGAYAPSAGRVRFDGGDITKINGNKRIYLGIARTFQNIRLFSSMSVLENVLIGMNGSFKYSFLEAAFHIGRYHKAEREARQKALELLDELGLSVYANESATSLSYGAQRKVEIARALASQPKLLMLDEPAAGMNPAESDELATLMLRLKQERGLTILLIEHDMKFVNRLCERVLVLDYGKVIFEGTPSDAITHEDVVAAYLGDFEC